MNWFKRIIKSIKNFFSRRNIIIIVNDDLSNFIRTGEEHKNDGIDMIWEDKYTIDPKLN